MSYVVFRFDIDSHICMKQGVPILLDISRKYNVQFTFFLNAGRAVSVWDTISSFFHKTEVGEHYDMLPAYRKLGWGQYLYAALANPKMIKYKRQLCELISSNNEVGLHGGMNHAKWYAHAMEWNERKTESEIDRALSTVRKICPEFNPYGFASPGFVSPDRIGRILARRQFAYISDQHVLGADEVVERRRELANVTVNLCGEPGGIAFWENRIARGFTDDGIIKEFMDFVEAHRVVVVFDHPYVVALKKSDNIEKIIVKLKEDRKSTRLNSSHIH